MDYTANEGNRTEFTPVFQMGEIWYGLLHYLNGLTRIPATHPEFTAMYGSTWPNDVHLESFLSPVYKLQQLRLLIYAPETALPDPKDDAPSLLLEHFLWCLLRLETVAAQFLMRLDNWRTGSNIPQPDTREWAEQLEFLTNLCEQQQLDHQGLMQKIQFVAPNLQQQFAALHNTDILSDAAQHIGYNRRMAEIKEEAVQKLDQAIVVFHRGNKRAQLLAQIETFREEVRLKQQFLNEIQGFSLATYQNIAAAEKLLYYLLMLNNWLKLMRHVLIRSKNDPEVLRNNLKDNIDKLYQRWQMIQTSCRNSTKRSLEAI